MQQTYSFFSFEILVHRFQRVHLYIKLSLLSVRRCQFSSQAIVGNYKKYANSASNLQHLCARCFLMFTFLYSLFAVIIRKNICFIRCSRQTLPLNVVYLLSFDVISHVHNIFYIRTIINMQTNAHTHILNA